MLYISVDPKRTPDGFSTPSLISNVLVSMRLLLKSETYGRPGICILRVTGLTQIRSSNIQMEDPNLEKLASSDYRPALIVS